MSDLRIEKLSMESTDITQENINKIKELFPQVVNEGKIDFDVLKTILGEQIENQNERYQFTWNGKSETIRFAQKPSTGTLRPDKESSKNWDTTENLYIEGDNLEVLKLLQKTYHNKIKMIYIDPPYNTGGDFVYKDDFKDSIKNYKEQTNQTLRTNPETSGRYHTDWLNMMYSRLMLAKNLLTDDGVIFISIDDNELVNLKLACNEIFGENNNIALCTRIAKRTSDKGTYFKPTKDYILVYSNNISNLDGFGVTPNIDINDYKYKDDKGIYKKNGASLYQPSLDSRPNQRYWIECPDGSFIIPPGNTFPKTIKDGEYIKPENNNDKVWRWSYPTYLQNKDKLIFTKAGKNNPLIDSDGNPSKWNIYDKVYLDEKIESTILPEDVIYEYVNSQGTKELISLGLEFSFTKPTKLIKYLIEILRTEKSIIVLDFFSGSSTTAHAVMQLNAEDDGSRKFIMVQLPEKTDEKTEAFKAGYNNICEIGKERIRRAGEKIKSELIDKNQKAGMLDDSIDPEKLDIGFKVYKLDSSNINVFDSSSKDINNIFNHDVFLSDRSKLDILYEILLKYGVFDKPVEVLNINNKEAYSVAFGHMLVFINQEITEQDINEVVALKPREVIIDERGFKTDNDKMNAVIRLEAAGVEKISTI